MTHTKGPWRVAGKNSGRILAPDGDGIVQVAVVGAYHDEELLPYNRKRWDADARLISCAPELLEALEAFDRAYTRLLNFDAHHEIGPRADDESVGVLVTFADLKAAHAAIAKARGTK